MRFLGIGDSCDLGALYLRLLADGHEVRVDVAEPLCHGTLAGLVPRTADWRSELDWIRLAGLDGVIVFENVAQGRGEAADALRRDGFKVIGGSRYGDRLENDRAYAQRILAGLGLRTARIDEFASEAEATRFLDARPGRYVLKFNGPGFASSDNYVGRLADGRDVRAMLSLKLRQRGERPASFVLMEHVDGIEMGVGAYFNGERFLRPACLDWEHKRFFPGDLGELTGEMGTVVTCDRTARFFERTLGRVETLLRDNGHCGYVNLNTIVNERGIWPLEFTCRFGYPGFAILDPLQETSWAELFRITTTRSSLAFATRPGFSVGIVLTTPPFPYTRREVKEPVGLPVLFDGDLTDRDREHLHYGEVGLDRGELVTSGLYGWTMVVTGVAPTIALAQANANRLAERIFVPNLRYRRDIGARLIAGEYERLERLGVFDPLPEAERGLAARVTPA
jgi:phosphoribosylamine--glycine ligase